jgi:hypothetical protein
MWLYRLRLASRKLVPLVYDCIQKQFSGEGRGEVPEVLNSTKGKITNNSGSQKVQDGLFTPQHKYYNTFTLLLC